MTLEVKCLGASGATGSWRALSSVRGWGVKRKWCERGKKERIGSSVCVCERVHTRFDCNLSKL